MAGVAVNPSVASELFFNMVNAPKVIGLVQVDESKVASSLH